MSSQGPQHRTEQPVEKATEEVWLQQSDARMKKVSLIPGAGSGCGCAPRVTLPHSLQVRDSPGASPPGICPLPSDLGRVCGPQGYAKPGSPLVQPSYWWEEKSSMFCSTTGTQIISDRS